MMLHYMLARNGKYHRCDAGIVGCAALVMTHAASLRSEWTLC
jgi:hypothetical protein